MGEEQWWPDLQNAGGCVSDSDDALQQDPRRQPSSSSFPFPRGQSQSNACLGRSIGVCAWRACVSDRNRACLSVAALNKTGVGYYGHGQRPPRLLIIEIYVLLAAALLVD
jgi:hypothetical protein